MLFGDRTSGTFCTVGCNSHPKWDLVYSMLIRSMFCNLILLTHYIPYAHTSETSSSRWSLLLRIDLTLPDAFLSNPSSLVPELPLIHFPLRTHYFQFFHKFCYSDPFVLTWSSPFPSLPLLSCIRCAVIIRWFCMKALFILLLPFPLLHLMISSVPIHLSTAHANNFSLCSFAFLYSLVVLGVFWFLSTLYLQLCSSAFFLVFMFFIRLLAPCHPFIHRSFYSFPRGCG